MAPASSQDTSNIIVQKFGGSSVADTDKIKQVAQVIAQTVQSGAQVVAVISAMGDTTNELLSLAKQISPNPPRREQDMLISVGERISMALLCMALHEENIPAVSLTGSQAGIMTNDRHNDARIIEIRPIRVEDELSKGNVVVVAGFQGTSYKREITTLGRGGTDATAVALTAALSASRCEIYSDVAGVFTADPRKVPDAQLLPEINYEQMLALADAGAVVMNEQAVRYAQSHQIKIHTAKTAAGVCDDSNTVIHGDCKDLNFAGITHSASVSVCLTSLSTMALSEHQLFAQGASSPCHILNNGQTTQVTVLKPENHANCFQKLKQLDVNHSLLSHQHLYTIVGDPHSWMNFLTRWLSSQHLEPSTFHMAPTQVSFTLSAELKLSELHQALRGLA